MPFASTKQTRSLPATALLVFAAALLPCFLRAQNSSQPAPTRSFIIRGARIFDGERLQPPADLLVSDGRIKAVGAKLQAPAGTTEIDGSGDTLLPGLIDAHAHPYADALHQALLFGVTTELSMFSNVKFDADVRQREAQGKNLDAADLRSSGTLVTVAKGHGTEYGIPIPTLASTADAQPFVDARLAEGSDYIKIIYDDGSAYGLKLPTLTKEEVAAVVAAGHKRHKLAVVHIGSQAGARDVIEAGADGLAHIFEDEPPAPDFVNLVKQHHAFVIPTLAVNESVTGAPSGASLVSDPRLSPYLNADVIGNLKQNFPNIRAARQISTMPSLPSALCTLPVFPSLPAPMLPIPALPMEQVSTASSSSSSKPVSLPPKPSPLPPPFPHESSLSAIAARSRQACVPTSSW